MTTIWIVAWLLCGIWCAAIANKKGLSAVRWAFVGIGLGLIGVLIVACKKPVAVRSGWYNDPWGEATWRWYDGENEYWTKKTSDTPAPIN
jgi:hypothetical protein